MEQIKINDCEYPTVTICTPTYNRRPFIPFLIECVKLQTYPQDKIEWVIIDDGTDKIEELVINIPFVRYYKYDKKMCLGKKRNITHEKATGSIIINFDDDDYYPPTRISHAVEMLNKNPLYNFAGCNELLMYLKDTDSMYRIGPYLNNHTTAASFAFNRCLIDGPHKLLYDDTASFAEEEYFLKKFNVPLLNLDSSKTIISYDHAHNTTDRTKLLQETTSSELDDSKTNINIIEDLKLSDFIINKSAYLFVKDEIHEKILHYNEGLMCNKSDILIPHKNIKHDDDDDLINSDVENIKSEINNENNMEIIINQINICRKNIKILNENITTIHKNQLIHQDTINNIDLYKKKYDDIFLKYNLLFKKMEVYDKYISEQNTK
jgi:glycosyltransferase involved in cell wall biosynthesis